MGRHESGKDTTTYSTSTGGRHAERDTEHTPPAEPTVDQQDTPATGTLESGDSDTAPADAEEAPEDFDPARPDDIRRAADEIAHTAENIDLILDAVRDDINDMADAANTVLHPNPDEPFDIARAMDEWVELQDVVSIDYARLRSIGGLCEAYTFGALWAAGDRADKSTTSGKEN